MANNVSIKWYILIDEDKKNVVNVIRFMSLEKLPLLQAKCTAVATKLL